MRYLHSVERSFVTKLVEKTRALLASSGPTALKVAVLKHWAQRQSERAEKLEARLSGAGPDRPRRIADMRRRAAGYLRATAKFITHRQEHPMTLREPPLFFADPDWGARQRGQDEDDPPQFMEFSS